MFAHRVVAHVRARSRIIVAACVGSGVGCRHRFGRGLCGRGGGCGRAVIVCVALWGAKGRRGDEITRICQHLSPKKRNLSTPVTEKEGICQHLSLKNVKLSTKSANVWATRSNFICPARPFIFPCGPSRDLCDLLECLT